MTLLDAICKASTARLARDKRARNSLFHRMTYYCRCGMATLLGFAPGCALITPVTEVIDPGEHAQVKIDGDWWDASKTSASEVVAQRQSQVALTEAQRQAKAPPTSPPSAEAASRMMAASPESHPVHAAPSMEQASAAQLSTTPPQGIEPSTDHAPSWPQSNHDIQPTVATTALAPTNEPPLTLSAAPAIRPAPAAATPGLRPAAASPAPSTMVATAVHDPQPRGSSSTSMRVGGIVRDGNGTAVAMIDTAEGVQRVVRMGDTLRVRLADAWHDVRVEHIDDSQVIVRHGQYSMVLP